MKKSLLFFATVFILFISCYYSLVSGTYNLTNSQLINILFEHNVNSQAWLILWEFRIPRLILSALVGGSLAIAGYILQTLTRNPIADAGLLGINSGSAFGSVLYYFIVGSYYTEANQIQSIFLIIFGILGALFALLLNFSLSLNTSGLNMSRFILNGIGINIGFSALTTYFSLKINNDDYSRVNTWLQGSISQANWISINQIFPWVLITFPLILIFQKHLNLLRYSDSQLKNIGFSMSYWRLLFILLAAILVCSSVIAAGNVAFVGLIIPYLSLKFFNHGSKWLIPAIFINGISLVTLCDTFVRNIFAPNELPLNSIIGLVGIPYLFLIFITNSNKVRKKNNATNY
ncbi:MULTISPECIES: iron ABC transporter permease [Lactococcus]|uniref:Ferrichrome transport system permease protein FhuG n=1 Tax=Lactococcus lactis subsp. cremoris TaxID=1359 RepID=A0A170MYQ5_LACLC|nr:iron ABC transporter permease [Lactococcus cremoris]KZK07349.1 Ferrichrome transport system permease protein FhuG [Lactococcus cremoris]